jgi:hypothetical protein
LPKEEVLMRRAIARYGLKPLLARLALTLGLALAGGGVLAGAAPADQPATTSVSTSDTYDFAAGSLCTFHFAVTLTLTGTATVFSDRTERHLVVTATHTNVDTGYTLTERDRVNQTMYPDGTTREEGLHWDLRDASGKLVFVGAGQFTYLNDPVLGLLSATPHVGADGAAVICPALGGALA